jgi:DNA-binding SARP family transcriptional activator
MDFSILGPLEVREGSQSIPIRRGKPAALLALLILRRNDVASTDVLVDELWENGEPPSAAKALQTYVSELRRVLPDGMLETRPPGYVLHVDHEALDSDRFEALLARARGELAEGRPEEARRILDEALGLWRGRALADFTYERFAEAERQRLDELRLAAVEARIEADLAQGAGAELVSELQTLVREHPYREAFTRQLMIALYRAGRQADALERYRESRRTLHDTLGLEPSPELQRLERAILEQDPELAASPARAGLGTPPSQRRPLWPIVAATAILAALGVLAVVLAVAWPENDRRGLAQDAAAGSTNGIRLPYPSVPTRLLGEYSYKPQSAADERWSRRTMIVTLRPASDPVCTDLLGGDKTCFTMIPADNAADPGARGEVALADGRKICFRYIRIPFERKCEGKIHMYLTRNGGRTFVYAHELEPCAMPHFVRS